MTRFLLDVNVLIALIDPSHVQHHRAHEWFASTGMRSWATCPMTENGVVRIGGHAKYPNTPGTPAAVAVILAAFGELAGHAFWPDDISLLRERSIETQHLLDSAQVSDTYLLALARAHNGLLATFDVRIVTNAVSNGAQSLHLIR